MESMQSIDQDLEHVRLVAIFHWVVAALAALVSLFPLLHLVVGIGMITGALGNTQDQGVLLLFGCFFVVFAGLFIVCGLTFAICLAIAGRRLREFRHHTYCLVMASLACMFIPFGTVLGVFTIILLVKPSIRAQFAENEATQA
jgi:hypothetical protein